MGENFTNPFARNFSTYSRITRSSSPTSAARSKGEQYIFVELFVRVHLSFPF
jgi:hypothetical protein